MLSGNSRLARIGLLLPLAMLITLTGCGTRSYSKLIDNRVARARGEAKFRTLYAPTDVPGAPLQIRVPLAFKPDQLFSADSKYKADDGGKIRPDRFQPPFLKWPGFQHCYEGQATSPDGRKLPFYLYLGSQPGISSDADKLATKFEESLKETFKDLKPEWQSIDCESPSEVAVQWRKLRVEADQPFLLIDGQGKVISENLPGIFEVWIAEKQGHLVVMAWRVPTAINAAASPDAPPPTMVGGIVLPSSGEIKPDINSMPVLMGGTLTVNPAAAGETSGG